MNKPLPDILSADWSWPNFRQDALQLLVWGYQRVEVDVRRRNLEEDITGLISTGINAEFDDMDAAVYRYFKIYSVKNENPVNDTGKFGKQRPKVDILIECSSTQPRVRYHFEAKRCARKRFKSRYKIDWYAQGIAAFVAGQYAKEAPEAGMLGLIQSDTALYWKAELSAKLSQDFSLACRNTLTNFAIPILPDLAVS